MSNDNDSRASFTTGFKLLHRYIEILARPLVGTSGVLREDNSKTSNLKASALMGSTSSAPEVRECGDADSNRTSSTLLFSKMSLVLSDISENINVGNLEETKILGKTPIQAEPQIPISLTKIRDIISKVESIQNLAEKFIGSSDSRQFRHLEASLLKCAAELDEIEENGNTEVKEQRKHVFKVITETLTSLRHRTSL